MYILGIDPNLVVASTGVPPFKLGQVGFDADGKGYQFVRANGTLSVGNVVQIDELGDATPATTTTSAPGTGQGLPVGVVVVALADNEWGWVQRYGVVGSISVGTSCAVHTIVNTTATAGRVDDDATAGAEVVNGLSTTAAEASNLAAGILDWPIIGRTL